MSKSKAPDPEPFDEFVFKEKHGACERCGGTGFEYVERGGVERARRCALLPPLAPQQEGPPPEGGAPRPSGFVRAGDVRLPYADQ